MELHSFSSAIGHKINKASTSLNGVEAFSISYVVECFYATVDMKFLRFAYGHIIRN